MDTSAEIRAMLLVAFPCPPLPLVSQRVEGEEKVSSSHDALSFCIDATARINDPKRNHQREALQEKLVANFHKQIELGFDLHATMTTFTRAYMQSYFPEKFMDARFLPFDYADNELLMRVREWLAAREIVSGNEFASSKDHEWKDPHHLYRDCAKAASIM